MDYSSSCKNDEKVSGVHTVGHSAPLVTVPNPKRTVPANLFSMTEDDTASPFTDDNYVLGMGRSIRSPIMDLNPSQDATKPQMEVNTHAKTPDIFEINGFGVVLVGSETRTLSRGVIGSARKVNTAGSQSAADDGLASAASVTNDAYKAFIEYGDQPTTGLGEVGAGLGWGRATSGAQHVQSPVGRPSSTPLYNSAAQNGNMGGSMGSTSRLDVPVVALGEGLLDGLNLSGEGSARGRGRDYSFGSLVGLNSQMQDAVGDSASRQSSHPSSSHVFADPFADPETWTAGATREQIIRGSLSMGGTVSAPPLLNMYSQGYNSINNHSAFGAQIAPLDRLDLLSARYESNTLQEQAPAAAVGKVVATGRTPFAESLPLQSSSQAPHADSASGGPREPESVEALVLRSCRDILQGAAERSLKAVELANTLRARVGTEALARIREKWGGLLSLLEKHTATFRVDRIPKNDKVTLLLSVVGAVELTTAGPLVGGMGIDALAQTGLGPRAQFGHSAEQGGAAAGGISTSGATRCLHVGNVPANMTESQLARDFEKFGQLEGLKMVSQRNGSRRFAFVTFQTVEQAVTARHALSKVHPWKSAISFAHKDFGGVGNTSEGAPRSHSGPVHAGVYGSAGRGYGTGADFPLGPPYSQQHLQQIPQQLPAGRNMQPAAMQFPYMHMGLGGMSTGGGLPFNAATPMYWMAPPTLQHMQPSTAFSGASLSNANMAVSTESSCPVLQRLCDDTYVPTQPWPVDSVRDQPYCAAVVAQLQQFGGFTTVSKLRGFLRNRIAATDNIKSVPLKALLLAYPQHFSLDGNYVYLSGATGGGAQQSLYTS